MEPYTQLPCMPVHCQVRRAWHPQLHAASTGACLGIVGFCHPQNPHNLPYPACSGDDAIAMHGYYYLVASADASNRSVILATDRTFAFSPGDTLTFYAANTSRLATARIANQLSVDDPLDDGSTSQQIQGFSYDDADFLQARLCKAAGGCCNHPCALQHTAMHA